MSPVSVGFAIGTVHNVCFSYFNIMLFAFDCMLLVFVICCFMLWLYVGQVMLAFKTRPLSLLHAM